MGGLATFNSGVYLTLTHRVNRQASDLTWRYQSSADLQTWAEVTPTLLSMVHLDADATDQVMIGVPATGAGRFLRAVITKASP